MATAASVSVPHLALPLRYLNGSALVNEQDQPDDIADCVYAICKTNPGDRIEMPDFGLLDPAFGQEPLPASAIQSQIEHWEPRARTLISAAPAKYDMSIVNAQVNVEGQTP